MHCSRPIIRSPSVIRVARPGACAPARNASFFPAPASFFGPRFHNPGPLASFNQEIAPFFKLMDDLTSPSFPQLRNHQIAYQPRFDVREVDGSYELRGELPGVEAKDIEVQFTDAQTLVIRGRTERESTSGTPPQTAAAVTDREATTGEATNAVAEKADAEADNKSDAGSVYSTGSYQKPSVADEEEGAAATTEQQAEQAQTSADAAARTQATSEQQQEVAKAPEQPQQPQQPSSRYWVSERTTGSFQRVFNFASRVDQDAVKANLKNGILSIVVPKAAAPEARRINVE